MTLAEEFRQTCQTYFPRWRAATAWSLEECPCPSWLQAQGTPRVTAAQGACDPTTRRIILPGTSENVLQRQAMLIHAICHAITTVGHGARFRAQMGQAAARALTVGATALAEVLRRHAHASRAFEVLKTCAAHKTALPPAAYEQRRDPQRLLSTSRGTCGLDIGTPWADTRARENRYCSWAMAPRGSCCCTGGRRGRLPRSCANRVINFPFLCVTLMLPCPLSDTPLEPMTTMRRHAPHPS